MDEKNLITLLKSMGLTKISKKSGWVMCSCPFSQWNHENGRDTKPSFGVSIGKTSTYHCFACDVKGPLTSLPSSLTFLLGRDLPEVRDFINQYENTLLETYESTSKKVLEVIPDNLYKKYSVASRVRGISLPSIGHWNLRYDDKEHRILFPIKDVFGRLVGIRGRALNGNSLRYRSYTELSPNGRDAKSFGVWFGMHFPLVEGKKLILVEGEIDAILLKQIGVQNVWASMGASIASNQMKTLKLLNVPLVTYFDNDKSGQNASSKIAIECGNVYKISNYHGAKDACDAIEKRVIFQVLKSAELA